MPEPLRAACRRNWVLLLALVSIAAVLLAACGGDDGGTAATAAGTPGGSTPAPASATASGGFSTQPSPTARPSANGATVTAANNSAVTTMQKLPLYPNLATGTLLGDPAAKVQLVVWEDFQCPHCLNYTVQYETMIREEYIKTGKISYRVMALPILGVESARAAVAGYCAAVQNVFFPFHRKLFLVQAEAGQLTAEKLNAGRFSDDSLLQYAVEAGADAGKFKACYGSDESLSAVTQEVQQAQQAGFRGTPAFMLQGQPLSGQPGNLDGWRKLLNDAIAAAK